ncbi:MAG: class I SAM-dependent methyltransferase, partial [Proteobacteria bacterium]
MNLNLLKPEIQAFITQHVGTDVTKLALLKNPFPEVDFKEILNQIASKTKAREKLPTWFNTSNILFPSKISVEQTSSEKTAKYKSGIVSGKSLIDLSGGFGVDDFWFSKTFEEVVHCESDAALSSIARHNFDVLGAANIVCKTGDSTQIVNDLDRRFDVIYVDPSRRHDQKGKVFLLRDCEPNVPELIDVYFEISETVMIKSAPILDISAAVSELKN